MNTEIHTKNIGKDTMVWQYCVILEGAKIGERCNINSHVFIENDVIIGNDVTVKCGVYLWDGIVIEDNVFIGPNVTFTNDKRPRSKIYPNNFQKITIKQGASIGAASIILGGTEIGNLSMVGAGSLVTNNVPDRALVMGSPAKIVGWLNLNGTKMIRENELYVDDCGAKWKVKNNELIKFYK